MRRFIALAFIVMLWIACIPTPPLAPHPQQFVNFGNETSVAFSLGSTPNKIITPGRTIVFYNGGSGFVWNTTTSGTFVPAAQCDATTPGFPCFVPMAPGQTSWAGDPFVAADNSNAGNGVVAVSMLGGTSATSGTPMVTISVSNNQGLSFRSTQQVNDEGCSEGQQDQPALAFDPLASLPTVWVVWRYAALATYGICVRGGQIDIPTGRVSWFGPSHEVQNVNRAPFYGVGGVQVRPKGNTVTVMYTNTDHQFKDCSGGKDVTWFTGTSPDLGNTWSGSQPVFDAPNFTWCTLGNKYIRPLRSFDFQRDASNNNRLWAVVNDTQYTAQVMFSDTEGASWTPSTTAVFASMYEPVLATDSAGRVGLFYMGSDERGEQMSTWIQMRRINSGLPDPLDWSEPQQVGLSFPSVTLQPCNVQCTAAPYYFICCPPVFDGDGNTTDNCVNNQCVGQRFGGGGDYMGMAVVASGEYDDDHERFAPAWQDSATPSTAVNMSFVDILE